MALLIGRACQAGEPGGSPPRNASPDSPLVRSHSGQADAIVNVPRAGTGIVGKMTPLRTSTAAEPPSITVVGELENGLKSRGAQDRGPFSGIGDLASNGSNQQSLVTLDTGRLTIALFVLALLAAVARRWARREPTTTGWESRDSARLGGTRDKHEETGAADLVRSDIRAYEARSLNVRPRRATGVGAPTVLRDPLDLMEGHGFQKVSRSAARTASQRMVVKARAQGGAPGAANARPHVPPPAGPFGAGAEETINYPASPLSRGRNWWRPSPSVRTHGVSDWSPPCRYPM